MLIRKSPRGVGAFALFIAQLFWLSLAQAAEPNAVELPKDCVERLNALSNQFGDFYVRYATNLEWASPQPNGFRSAGEAKNVFYSEPGRFFSRNERSLVGPKSSRRSDLELSYDGQVLYYGQKTDADKGTIAKHLGENPDDRMADNYVVSCSYLDAAGIDLPKYARDWGTTAPESFILRSVRDGKLLSVVTENDQLVARLEVPEPAVVAARKQDVDTLRKNWASARMTEQEVNAQLADYERMKAMKDRRIVKCILDPKRSYAITHREDSTPDGKRIQTIDCKDFKAFDAQKCWLPQQCVVRRYVDLSSLANFSDEPRTTLSIKLEEISFDKRDEISFQLEYGPGSIVIDRSTLAAKESGESESYRVPEPRMPKPAGATNWLPRSPR
jgi:hypothetical protein